MSRPFDRRTFLTTVTSALATAPTVLASTIAGSTGVGAPREKWHAPDPQNDGTGASRVTTIQDVIDLIMQSVPGPRNPETVDTFKSGNPSDPVTGVVTTFLATSDVITEAASRGANLIITHEPTYYNHLDQVDWLADDPIYAHKRGLLDDQGIAVWRFHDYWHQFRPDGILSGLLRKLGWEDRAATEDDRNRLPSVIQLDPTPLADVAAHFKTRLNIERPLQLVGNASMTISRIGLMPGAYGGRGHIEFLRSENFDLLVVGEINEWETSVYVEDSRTAGRNRALLILGHAASEEPGMEWLAEWLQGRLGDVPVSHIPSRDPFTMI